MHFGFVLDSSDIDLRNIDLLDAHLDLLVTDIPGKYFVYLQDILKTSSRYIFKTSSRHVFKTFSRHLRRNNFSSSKTSWRCLQDVLRDAFKTSLQDVFKMSRKTRSYYAEDMLKTSSRHALKTSSRPLEDQKMFAGFAFVS